MTMDPIQRLIEIEALHSLKARYWRCWDTKDFEGWLALFLDDATLTADMRVPVRGETGAVPALKVVGKQQLRETVCANNAHTVTVHQGHSPEIELHSDSEASGIWAMEDIVERGAATFHGHGHYRETYRKVDGQWRFASIHLTRVRLTSLAF